MIIVSQDNEIIKFDNITRIFVKDFSEYGDGFGIGAETNSAEDQCLDLGYYETYERAYEGLKEIIFAYKCFQGKKATIGEIEKLSGKYENAVFEMPEE